MTNVGVRNILCIIWLAFLTLPSFAQRVKTVKQSTTYYAPLNMSLTEAKLAAAEQARTEALAEAFGKIVSNHTFSDASTINGNERDDFQMLSSSIAKGIWLEDTEKPEFENPEIIESQNIVVIKVTVRGKVREITTTPIDLQVALLRNSTDKRNEEYNYKKGDDMYISFESPINGNLIVYVRGIDDVVQVLLPLEEGSGGSIEIQANKPYMFFSENDDNTDDFAGLTLTCEGGIEYNRFYFIFSPNKITKARDTMGSKKMDNGLLAPRELTEKDFRKWLVTNMDHDSDLNVVIKDIRIVDSSINN